MAVALDEVLEVMDRHMRENRDRRHRTLEERIALCERHVAENDALLDRMKEEEAER